MLKLFAFAATLCAAIAIGVGPAGAVTGNFTVDTVHNYVAMVTFYDASGNFLWRCSGSLLNSRTVLTAGHCADLAGGASYAYVRAETYAGTNYDPALGYDPTTGYPGPCLAGDPLCSKASTLYSYGFNNFAGYPNTHDLGLVILDNPINLDQYAALAAPGSLDQLSTQRGLQDQSVTISGYGVSGEKPQVVSYRTRLMATSNIINLHNSSTAGFNIQLTTNPGGNKGGTCFGDSGGPILYDSTNIIIGVNSFVKNLQCAGTSFAYRTDQVDAINWILAHAWSPQSIQIVPLPI